MPAVKNLEEFNKLRQEVQALRETSLNHGQILVALGTCGIACGAADTWDAIQKDLAAESLDSVELIPTGCIGLCHSEPIVQVRLGNQPAVIYGNVTPVVAGRIVKEHVRMGRIVQEYVIPGGAA
jgi:(2Fe-2S) ferredoxin